MGGGNCMLCLTLYVYINTSKRDATNMYSPYKRCVKGGYRDVFLKVRTWNIKLNSTIANQLIIVNDIYHFRIHLQNIIATLRVIQLYKIRIKENMEDFWRSCMTKKPLNDIQCKPMYITTPQTFDYKTIMDRKDGQFDWQQSSNGVVNLW